MVLFQGVEHIQIPKGKIQHSKRVQAKLTVQIGHEDNDLQSEIILRKKPQLAPWR